MSIDLTKMTLPELRAARMIHEASLEAARIFEFDGDQREGALAFIKMAPTTLKAIELIDYEITSRESGAPPLNSDSRDC